MLLCLLHVACGLALAAPPAPPQQFARLQRADRTLEAVALPDGAVALKFERRDANGDLVARRAFQLHPGYGGAFEARLEVEAQAIMIGWRRAGDVNAPQPSVLGETLIVSLEGDGIALERLARFAARGAGEHPGIIVCPAGGGAAAQVRDEGGLGVGAEEHPGRIECPAGPGLTKVAATRAVQAKTAERKPGRLVHPPGLPD